MISNYKIVDGFVYEIETDNSLSITTLIDSVNRVQAIAEPDRIILKWQYFDTHKGCYLDDFNNRNPIEYNGSQYSVENGRTEIPLRTVESTTFELGKQLALIKLENMKLHNFILNIGRENVKTRLEIMKLKKEVES